MKKIKKKNILTHPSGPQSNLKQLFCANTKSKSVVSLLCAYVNKNIMAYIYPICNKNIFFFSPREAYPEILNGIKISRIQEIENLTLGHLVER
jgi:hypothetical protein